MGLVYFEQVSNLGYRSKVAGIWLDRQIPN